MNANFTLTSRRYRVYSSSIAAQVVIWFGSQKHERVAASCGIFMPVCMTSLSFIGWVVWGALCSLVLVFRSVNPYDSPTLSTDGGGILNRYRRLP